MQSTVMVLLQCNQILSNATVLLAAATVSTVASGAVTLFTSDEAVGFGEERVLFLKELKDMHLIVATCPMAKNAETDQVNSCQVV